MIMAILALVCTSYPETLLSILFVPGFTFSAGNAIKVIMAVDLAGCRLRWRFLDHAAHLGGAICMELLTKQGWSSAYTVEAVIM